MGVQGLSKPGGDKNKIHHRRINRIKQTTKKFNISETHAMLSHFKIMKLRQNL